MAIRTIAQGFEKFHSNITPSSYESGKAKSHKDSIEAKLKEDFDLSKIFYSGSANNGTSISTHSDVDLFASIPASKLRENSLISLREVKKSLEDRFPNTSIYVSSPAVVCDFGYADWDTAEVVPAHYLGTENDHMVYDIPNGSGGWMKSSPNAHNAYVREHNNRLSNKLKKLIRFAKAWKYYKNVPISSFYLELRITKWMESESTFVYDIDMASIFRKLENCGLAAIQDPMGISGYVYACSSEAKKEDALSKVKTASTGAQKAREQEEARDTHSAFTWWNLVFNSSFPSYYY